MKNILLIAIACLLLLLGGCAGEVDAQRSTFETSGFHGGNDALIFNFAEQAPPAKVRDQSLQPFSVRLLVENLGEYDISEGSAHMTLTGFNPADLGIEGKNTKALNALRGFKKQGANIIPGGKQQVVFDNLKYIGSVVSGEVPLTIYANLCYPYETKAFALICINGDTIPAIDERTQICNLEGDKRYANSGAPIQIQEVKQYPYGESSIQVQFKIVHNPTSPSANFYQRGSIDSNCNINGFSPSSPYALDSKDKITYVIDSGIPGLNCEGTGTNTNTITLINNEYTVTCIQDTTGQAEYEKPIVVTMSYDYLDRKSVVVNIEHIER